MQQKITIKMVVIFAIVPFLLFSCVSKNENPDYEQITDSDKIGLLTGYNLEYKINVPGNNGVSYNVLWTGYDDKQPFPYLPVSKEDRYSTYLTSYSENSEEYFLIYLSKQDINKSKSWLKEYDKNNSADINNYHFSSDSDVIDGKYLLYAQKNNITSYSVYRTSDLSSIAYSYERKQLVFCLQTKTLTIEKNVSSGQTLNKNISIYRRIEMKYNSLLNKVESYVFDNDESINVQYIDRYFSYIGKKLETYPSTFEDISYIYCPFLKTNSAEIIDDKIILPHYVKIDNLYYDLLDNNFIESFFQDDIYRNFKPLFREAFLSDVNSSEENPTYKYAYFDCEKVMNIVFNSSGGEK